eukprot:2709425-Alexandrium_andersonii.AAC.1
MAPAQRLKSSAKDSRNSGVKGPLSVKSGRGRGTCSDNSAATRLSPKPLERAPEGAGKRYDCQPPCAKPSACSWGNRTAKVGAASGRSGNVPRSLR